MNKFLNLNIVLGVILLLTSCATSMTPMKINNTLPSLTESNMISKSKVEELIQSDNCKYLVKGRTYVAPMGLSVKNDLKNGAKGIDEWVELDGGNSYVLNSYKWLTVDDSGSTQLHLEFDTLNCE